MKLPSPTEMLLLRILGNYERSSTELKKLHYVDTGRDFAQGTFYAAMRRLEIKKWVISKRDKKDRRNVLYRLTTQGWRNFKHLKALTA